MNAVQQFRQVCAFTALTVRKPNGRRHPAHRKVIFNGWMRNGSDLSELLQRSSLELSELLLMIMNKA